MVENSTKNRRVSAIRQLAKANRAILLCAGLTGPAPVSLRNVKSRAFNIFEALFTV